MSKVLGSERDRPPTRDLLSLTPLYGSNLEANVTVPATRHLLDTMPTVDRAMLLNPLQKPVLGSKLTSRRCSRKQTHRSEGFFSKKVEETVNWGLAWFYSIVSYIIYRLRPIIMRIVFLYFWTSM